MEKNERWRWWIEWDATALKNNKENFKCSSGVLHVIFQVVAFLSIRNFLIIGTTYTGTTVKMVDVFRVSKRVGCDLHNPLTWLILNSTMAQRQRDLLQRRATVQIIKDIMIQFTRPFNNRSSYIKNLEI
jgi:hypothetical protein